MSVTALTNRIGLNAIIADELVTIEETTVECRRAQLATMLRLGAELRMRSGGAVLVVDVDRESVARQISREIAALLGVKATVLLQGRNSRQVCVADGAAGVVHGLGLAKLSGGRLFETEGLPLEVVGGTPNQMIAALRGAVLVAGTINGKTELEIRCPSPESACALALCARALGVVPQVRERRGFDVVVVRDFESTKTLLGRIGALQAVEELERKRIRQKMDPGGVFATANARRVAEASTKTAGRVEWALRILGVEAPEQLAEVGQLRLKYREASLTELGTYATPPITKDAVAGRLRRLEEAAVKRAAEQSSDAVYEAVALGFPATAFLPAAV